jgi:MFS family permease
MLMNVAFFGTSLLFEVPSGIFADLHGRKKSIALGAVLYSISMLGFVTAPSLGLMFGIFPLWFFLSECLAGVSFAFASGADTAWLYDTLKRFNRQSDFKKVKGFNNSLYFITTAIASFFGALIAKFGLEKPYYFTALAAIIAFLFVLTFEEPKHYKRLGKRNYWKHQKECFFFVMTHKKVRWLSFYYGLVNAMSFIGIVVFFQLYLQHIGVPLAHYSIIFPAVILFGALVSANVHKIESWIGDKLTLHLLPPLMAITYILMYFFDFYWAFLLLFVLEGIFALVGILIDNYVHEHVRSEQRATVVSIRNMFAGLSLAFLSPFVGWIGDKFGLVNSFLTAGLVVFVFGVILFLTEKKSRI